MTYWSAHLDGVASETVSTSAHSLQETPQAILEIRKLLRRTAQRQATTPPTTCEAVRETQTKKHPAMPGVFV